MRAVFFFLLPSLSHLGHPEPFAVGHLGVAKKLVGNDYAQKRWLCRCEWRPIDERMNGVVSFFFFAQGCWSRTGKIERVLLVGAVDGR